MRCLARGESVAIVACAVLMGSIIACFAEVSSRFRETGGPYLYAAEAFGPTIGFLIGWLLWLSRITGICAVTGIMVEYVAYALPSVMGGAPRAALVVAVYAGLSVLHISGVKRAANVGNVLTVLKLAPLLLVVGVGAFHFVPARFDFTAMPSNHAFSKGVLLLAFAFVGWESALVAAGELRDPQRDTPFAITIGLAVVALLYVAIQVVCVDAAAVARHVDASTRRCCSSVAWTGWRDYHRRRRGRIDARHDQRRRADRVATDVRDG